jgi:hypothetical protein
MPSHGKVAWRPSKEAVFGIKIIKPSGVSPVPIDGRPERGTTIPLVDAALGTENLDVHFIERK